MLSQEIGWEERLRIDLFSGKWLKKATEKKGNGNLGHGKKRQRKNGQRVKRASEIWATTIGKIGTR